MWSELLKIKESIFYKKKNPTSGLPLIGVGPMTLGPAGIDFGHMQRSHYYGSAQKQNRDAGNPIALRGCCYYRFNSG